jgi:hypothetical protein
MNNENVSLKDVTLADQFALAAMQQLMQNWERFNDIGLERSDFSKQDAINNFSSITAEATSFGWGGTAHVIDGRDVSFAEKLGIESYVIADSMLFARELRMKQPNPAADIDRYLFVGGPWHGKYLLGENAPYVVCEPGQYHRHAFGIEGQITKAVYVWSELHAEEAVDLVLSCVK